MKIKLIIPEEIEIGKDFTAKIVEILEPVGDLLFQAYNEPEVFTVLDNIKHWIQNPETAQALKYDIYKRKQVSLAEINKYPTGDTFNTIGEPKRARDIYYPVTKSYPFKGLRGLLTLGPVPSGQLAKELGFNAIMPYAGVPSGWDGDLITVWQNDKAILRYIEDESDCHQRNPDDVYRKYLEMKNETPNIPIGINLEGGIGCGYKNGYDTIEAYQEKWIEIANKVDYVSLNIYPYRPDWPSAIEEMERFYHFWNGNIDVPIIPVIQAHWITLGLTKPDPIQQIKFWFGKGLTAYIVYPWKDENRGVKDMQEEWKLANEWAQEEVRINV